MLSNFSTKQFVMEITDEFKKREMKSAVVSRLGSSVSIQVDDFEKELVQLLVLQVLERIGGKYDTDGNGSY